MIPKVIPKFKVFKLLYFDDQDRGSYAITYTNIDIAIIRL